MNRRRFLEVMGGTAALGGIYAVGAVDGDAPGRPNNRPAPQTNGVDLVAVEGGPRDYAVITERAINEIGGIEAFVRPGDRVAITPNIGWMRTPEQAAATHPDVLRRVIELCQRAGASRITCVDYALDDWRLSFDICGANAAVAGTRATLVSPDDEALYRELDVPEAVPDKRTDSAPYACVHRDSRLIQKAPKEVLRADAFICLPVVKDHEAAVISIAMKKLMGCIWNRKDYHRHGLHECIAELNMALRPTLIVADATRVLQTRGPKGPGEVSTPHQVVAGVDPVAVDSYCTRYLTTKGITPDQVPHLILGHELGRGRLDVDTLNVKEIAGA